MLKLLLSSCWYHLGGDARTLPAATAPFSAIKPVPGRAGKPPFNQISAFGTKGWSTGWPLWSADCMLGPFIQLKRSQHNVKSIVGSYSIFYRATVSPSMIAVSASAVCSSIALCPALVRT